MKLLLTAFEPFDNEKLNPSLEALNRINSMRFTGSEILAQELPVDRHKAVETALAAIQQASPDVVVMLGEAGGRFRITPERVAINIDDFRIADNAGNKPADEPIIETGPAAYFSTLPNRKIVERLVAERIPAAISNSAGTYLCNRLFYSVMHAISTRRLRVRAGFIHLPYLHEQTIPKLIDQPSLALETIVEGVRLAVDVSLEEAKSLRA